MLNFVAACSERWNERLTGYRGRVIYYITIILVLIQRQNKLFFKNLQGEKV